MGAMDRNCTGAGAHETVRRPEYIPRTKLYFVVSGTTLYLSNQSGRPTDEHTSAEYYLIPVIKPGLEPIQRIDAQYTRPGKRFIKPLLTTTQLRKYELFGGSHSNNQCRSTAVVDHTFSNAVACVSIWTTLCIDGGRYEKDSRMYPAIHSVVRFELFRITRIHSDLG